MSKQTVYIFPVMDGSADLRNEIRTQPRFFIYCTAQAIPDYYF